jgi:CheY-like chemotaxis protein
MSAATPTVYFIDDSATMREVIKIAFRRENIHVIACHDAATAFAEIEQTAPDVVITDVIMPDKDGYDVCQYIKQHPKFAATPVILMSGVVNRAVAEKAFSVKADELIRKPFQPQDLITRVKHLLHPAGASPPAAAPSPAATVAALSSIFAQATVALPGNGGTTRRPASPPPLAAAANASVSPLAAAFASAPASVPATAPATPPTTRGAVPNPAAAASPGLPAAASTVSSGARAPMDAQKLKFEIMRLETIVKKLQADLDAERQYSRALEDHIKTLQEAE